jgi:hypothetical protein
VKIAQVVETAEKEPEPSAAIRLPHQLRPPRSITARSAQRWAAACDGRSTHE